MSLLSKQEPIWALETVLASKEASIDRMLRSVFGWWVQTDVEGAITAMIDKVPEELRTEQVIDPFCYACSGCPVEKVLEWAKELPDENVANKFLSKVAGDWPKDIPGALRLLEELSESKWREQAVSRVASHWVSQNVTAAEECRRDLLVLGWTISTQARRASGRRESDTRNGGQIDWSGRCGDG